MDRYCQNKIVARFHWTRLRRYNFKRVIYIRFIRVSRSHLKNRILVQGQGGVTFQPAGILLYFEELKREPNAEIGPKDIFEIASIANQPQGREPDKLFGMAHPAIVLCYHNR